MQKSSHDLNLNGAGAGRSQLAERLLATLEEAMLQSLRESHERSSENVRALFLAYRDFRDAQLAIEAAFHKNPEKYVVEMAMRIVADQEDEFGYHADDEPFDQRAVAVCKLVHGILKKAGIDPYECSEPAAHARAEVRFQEELRSSTAATSSSAEAPINA